MGVPRSFVFAQLFISNSFSSNLPKTFSITMIAKITILFAAFAFANAGIVAPIAAVASVAHPPASTVKLANVAPVVTYASAPVVHHQQVIHAPAAVSYAAAPVAYAAPVQQVIPAVQTVVHQPRVTVVHEPVEQHGYKIAY